jgi:protein-S-isoprenylcysteine O-methyltransferase Ste14
MAHDRLQQSALSRALADLFTDLSDFLRKEVQLARAEMTHNISVRLYAGVWMAAAAVLGLIAGLLLIEAIVFALASTGLALHWSCLVMAAVLAVLAVGFFYYGRASMGSQDVTPTRSVRQFSEALHTAKEQL